MTRFRDLPVGSHFYWVALPSCIMIKTTSNSSRHNFENKRESTPVTSFTHFMPTDPVELVQRIPKKPKKLWGTVAVLLAGITLLSAIMIFCVSGPARSPEEAVDFAAEARAEASLKAIRAYDLKHLAEMTAAREAAEQSRLAEEAKRMRLVQETEAADIIRRREEATKWEIYQAKLDKDKKEVADEWTKRAAESSASWRAYLATDNEADRREHDSEERIAALEDAEDARFWDQQAKRSDDERYRREQEQADSQAAVAAQRARWRQQDLDQKIDEIARRQRMDRNYRMKN